MPHVVLVNWNGDDDTIACLQSLRDNSEPCHVIICDNGSRPDSVERILAWVTGIYGAAVAAGYSEEKIAAGYSWSVQGADGMASVTLFALKQNYGFAAGNNVGIRSALANPDCDYVFLLNNDTLVARDAIRNLRHKMDTQPDIAVCGVTLVYDDDPQHTQGLGGTFNLFSGRSWSIYRDGDIEKLPEERDVEGKIDYVIGAALFARASVFRRTGGLSEDYFLFFEELDLSNRLIEGERLGWSRNSVIRHKVGSSIGTKNAQRSSDWAIYYDHRSKVVYYRKFHLSLVPFLIYRTLYNVAAYARKADLRGAKMIVLATIDGFSGRRRQPHELAGAR